VFRLRVQVVVHTPSEWSRELLRQVRARDMTDFWTCDDCGWCTASWLWFSQHVENQCFQDMTAPLILRQNRLMWKTRDDRELFIDEMSESHLVNAIAWVRRQETAHPRRMFLPVLEAALQKRRQVTAAGALNALEFGTPTYVLNATVNLPVSAPILRVQRTKDDAMWRAVLARIWAIICGPVWLGWWRAWLDTWAALGEEVTDPTTRRFAALELD